MDVTAIRRFSTQQPGDIVASRSFSKLLRQLSSILRAARPAEHVVVFDIDATLLYNTDDNQCGAVPNFKIQKLYDLAEQQDMAIYVVTARIGTPGNRAATIRQLHCMGFDTFDGLYMRGAEHRTMPQIARFKRDARADIERKTGKRVLLNAGDQWTDHVVTSEAEYDALDDAFGAQHVLYMPAASEHAVYALKLYETKD